jgi:hypothetical protein
MAGPTGAARAEGQAGLPGHTARRERMRLRNLRSAALRAPQGPRGASLPRCPGSADPPALVATLPVESGEGAGLAPTVHAMPAGDGDLRRAAMGRHRDADPRLALRAGRAFPAARPGRRPSRSRMAGEPSASKRQTPAPCPSAKPDPVQPGEDRCDDLAQRPATRLPPGTAGAPDSRSQDAATGADERWRRALARPAWHAGLAWPLRAEAGGGQQPRAASGAEAAGRPGETTARRRRLPDAFPWEAAAAMRARPRPSQAASEAGPAGGCAAPGCAGRRVAVRRKRRAASARTPTAGPPGSRGRDTHRHASACSATR